MVKSIGVASTAPGRVAAVPGQKGPKPTNFSEIRDALKRSPDIINVLGGGDLHQTLLRVKDQIIQGKSFGPRELLIFQMQASELNLRVELLAKTADSALSSLRRLQSNQ